MQFTRLEHRFCTHIPENLDPGVLYVSMEFATAAHSCCCGCGEEIVTPFTPTDWRMTFDGRAISLWPSVGNWSLQCRSHYVVRNGVVIEAPPWSDQEIAADAERVLAEINFEIAVLQTLEAALDEARASARDRYVEPVMAELEPLVRLLWPEAIMRIDAEKVLPTALQRSGTEEKFEVLSGGTQEQIALLVRLAFARMLARSGTPAPVILDDAIVFTDDDRIERMFDALTRQAKDLQIIVLSCRQRAFRDLGGRGLAIVPSASEQ